MTFKGRMLLALVHFIARIQGGALWLKRRIRPNPPQPIGPERTLILKDEGPIIHFMSAAFFSDKITERYGIVGQPAPREQHPIAIRENIQDRIDELVEDGYRHLKDHPTANRLKLVANQLSVDSDTTFSKWREALAEFLDERGLGLIEDERPLDQGYSITILTSLPAIAGPLTLGFVKDSAFSEFTLDEVKTDNV